MPSIKKHFKTLNLSKHKSLLSKSKYAKWSFKKSHRQESKYHQKSSNSAKPFFMEILTKNSSSAKSVTKLLMTDANWEDTIPKNIKMILKNPQKHNRKNHPKKWRNYRNKEKSINKMQIKLKLWKILRLISKKIRFFKINFDRKKKSQSYRFWTNENIEKIGTYRIDQPLIFW